MELEESKVTDLEKKEIAFMVANINDYFPTNNPVSIPQNPNNCFVFSQIDELNSNLGHMLQNDPTPANPNPAITDLNLKLVDYALENAQRKPDGRLIIPLFWNPSIKGHRSRNYKIAHSMLKSSHKKLSQINNGLIEVDKIFKEQEKEGIIEKIDNLSEYLELHPNAAFLAHMPVVREDAKSTKIRVVFLPTQKEKSTNPNVEYFSNNQCILSGPNLNNKIVTAVQNLRFGKYLLTYDLKKAFLSIELPECDKDKLIFLWFKDVQKDNFEIVAFRNARLPFGIKCSPAILTLALYKALILDSNEDESQSKLFKRYMYQNLYVDNGSIMVGSKDELPEAKRKCEEALNPYKFQLQQFITNDPDFQNELDLNEDEPTPINNKLLGVFWNRIDDKLGPKLIELDPNAKTKRQLLQTINSVYDVLGLYLPIINKAKKFMQQISVKKELDWDTPFPGYLLREWKYICRYINNSGPMEIARNMGDVNDEFHLACFTDASKMCYGIVMYLINITKNQVHFLFASNHFNSLSFQKKSTPELEMRGVAFGSTKLISTHNEFTGPLIIQPLNITKLFLYNDSMNTLQRIHIALYQFDKLKAPSAFVKNAIKVIGSNCDKMPINFGFVSGGSNPADHVTRIMRYDKLLISNYLTGPTWLLKDDDDLRFRFKLPHPLANPENSLLSDEPKLGETNIQSLNTTSNNSVDCGTLENQGSLAVATLSTSDIENNKDKDNCKPSNNIQIDEHDVEPDFIISDSNSFVKCSYLKNHSAMNALTCKESDPEVAISLLTSVIMNDRWQQSMEELFTKYSEFRRPISVMRYVLKFLHGYKRKMRTKNPNFLPNSTVFPLAENYYTRGLATVLEIEQKIHYPEVYDFLLNPKRPKKDIPDFVNRFNPVLVDGLIRIKSQIRCTPEELKNLPILLPGKSNITKLLIEKTHKDTGDGGAYVILNELHKKYFLEKQFTVVKKVLNNCVNCKRFYNRTIKLNTNSYREFRQSPKQIPFKTIFLDHIGSYTVYTDESKKVKTKVYVLIFTYLWSRSINLKLCLRADTDEFLRAFQSHVLDFGLPSQVLSDQGSSIKSGSNIILDNLNECETQRYFTENQIETPEFEQYAKGNSALGSLVESLVKAVRLHIGKVFGKKVLTQEGFRYLVSEAQHFVNKRPICFKESLRDIRNKGIIEPITPEILLKGYSVDCLSIAPNFSTEPQNWLPEGQNAIRQANKDLNESREFLRTVYHEEFLQNIVHQAVDKPDRYKPVKHRPLKIGDIVLIKNQFSKPLAYPMGIVIQVEINNIGESTAAYIKKGATGETVYRHTSSLILLIPNEYEVPEHITINNNIADKNNLNQVNSASLQNNSIAKNRPTREAAKRCMELIHQQVRQDAV